MDKKTILIGIIIAVIGYYFTDFTVITYKQRDFYHVLDLPLMTISKEYFVILLNIDRSIFYVACLIVVYLLSDIIEEIKSKREKNA